MDRIDLNTGFQTRCEAERALLVTSEDIADHDGKVAPGTNLKNFDDFELTYGNVARVLGGKADDPTNVYCAWMDWSVANSFTVGTLPVGDINNQLIVGRAPADPEDVDPIYVPVSP